MKTTSEKSWEILLTAAHDLKSIGQAEMSSKIMDIYLDDKKEDRLKLRHDVGQIAINMAIVLESMWPNNWHDACEANLIDCRMSLLRSCAKRANMADVILFLRDKDFYRIKAEDCEDFDRYPFDDVKKFVTEMGYLIEPLLPEWDGIRGSSAQMGMP